MPFDQLSIVWQVWGYMLLGAILMGCGLLVGIEWAWLSFCARAAWTASRAWCVRTFTAAGDPYPQTAETIARAKAAQRRDLALVEIQRSVPRPARTPHADDTLRRRQLLALAESSPARRTVH